MKISSMNSALFTKSDLRLDASYHLSEGPMAIKKLSKSPYPVSSLKEECSRIFSGNIFKRSYVSSSEFGIPYLTGSDMVKANIDGGKFLSKKYTGQVDNLMIRKDWILISCSGTLGNTVFTNDDFEGRIGTHDLIRAIPNENNTKKGYLYAYLASKIGYALLTQSSYGGVVKHIEPHHIKDLPIPILPEAKQQEIHDLIVEAADLRVKANELLRGAIELLEKKLPPFLNHKTYTTGIKQRFTHNFRIDATYDAKSIGLFYRELEKCGAVLKTVGEVSDAVYTPGIFKRIRTENPDTGIPFLSGSDLLESMPSFARFLSKKMKNINNYILNEGWLVIQDAGTIGYLSLVTKYLEGVSATNNLVRVKPKENDNHNFYIYCFLKTKSGQKLLKSFEYGSVQKHIDNHQIKALKIPIFPDLFDEISSNVKEMMINSGSACFKENKAISLIEHEIDSWQKS